MNYNQENKVSSLKTIAWFVTLLSVAYSSYVIYEKYNQLKLEYKDLVSDNLYYEYFPSSHTYNTDYNSLYDLAKENHIHDDDLEKLIDSRLSDENEKAKIEELKEEYKEDVKTFDSVIKSRRETLRNRIIDNRAKKEADLIFEKEKFKQDSLRDIQLHKLSLETDQVVAKENMLSHFPIPYIIGVLLGTSILPVIFWILYFAFKNKIEKTISNDLNREAKLFESNHLTSDIFIKKSQSILNLKQKNIITKEEYEKKYLELFDECRAILKNENIKERNREIIQSLDDALANGIISKEEYLSKKEDQTINTDSISKIANKISNCPVCKVGISETDRKCPGCGIVLKEN